MYQGFEQAYLIQQLEAQVNYFAFIDASKEIHFISIVKQCQQSFTKVKPKSMKFYCVLHQIRQAKFAYVGSI